ncbi:MAG: RdgB/HAM1 family non-canonical purine NTP pyrophosphatase [Candidatus Aerophobetes bacterium]|nr:RdgB/HAM1 family non-canonical purine NTP pyrophosphatase [Candidatus Aerophobetes bacterium]
MELVLATRNIDKIREIRDLLSDLKINPVRCLLSNGVKLLTFKDFSTFPPSIEDKRTLRGNALKKAETIAKFTGKIALADDSGLEVEALGGTPGVFSSRFAGKGASYEDNNRKLLSLLKGVDSEKRKAVFRCVIAIVDPYGGEKLVEGVCRGKITLKKRGNNGFGYDPIFLPGKFNKTFGEMSAEEKNRISHRAKALKKVKFILEERLNKGRVFGLTGNIGSGKTTVGKIFAELGASLIEADTIGHHLLEKDEVKRRVVKEFGESILDEEGSIIRKKLRKIVFRDKNELQKLNSILSPLIKEDIEKRVKNSLSSLIVLDAAILLEAGWDSLADKIIVVTASPDVQLKRLKEAGDFTPEELEGVMQAQLSQEEKVKRADFIIQNDNDFKGLKSRVKDIWLELIS